MACFFLVQLPQPISRYFGHRLIGAQWQALFSIQELRLQIVSGQGAFRFAADQNVKHTSYRQLHRM
jgi:hypothetical protein